jgi:hypothetical protein
VGLVHDQVVNPRVAGVVEDALDRDASDGDEFLVSPGVVIGLCRFPVRLDEATEEPILLLVGPRPDERLAGVGPELAQDGDRRVPLGLGLQFRDSRVWHVEAVVRPGEGSFVPRQGVLRFPGEIGDSRMVKSPPRRRAARRR